MPGVNTPRLSLSTTICHPFDQDAFGSNALHLIAGWPSRQSSAASRIGYHALVGVLVVVVVGDKVVVVAVVVDVVVVGFGFVVVVVVGSGRVVVVVVGGGALVVVGGTVVVVVTLTVVVVVGVTGEVVVLEGGTAEVVVGRLAVVEVESADRVEANTDIGGRVAAVGGTIAAGNVSTGSSVLEPKADDPIKITLTTIASSTTSRARRLTISAWL